MGQIRFDGANLKFWQQVDWVPSPSQVGGTVK